MPTAPAVTVVTPSADADSMRARLVRQLSGAQFRASHAATRAARELAVAVAVEEEKRAALESARAARVEVEARGRATMLLQERSVEALQRQLRQSAPPAIATALVELERFYERIRHSVTPTNAPSYERIARSVPPARERLHALVYECHEAAELTAIIAELMADVEAGELAPPASS